MQRSLSILAVIFSLAVAAQARAEAPSSPKDRIDQMYVLVKGATMKADTHDQLVVEVTGYLDGLIDYDGFASRTLKTTWPTLTPAQRATFIDKFKALIIRTYAKRFQPKSEFTVEHRLPPTFLNDAQTEAKVQTTVHGKKVAADVDYMLTWKADPAGKKSAWYAYDFVIDDVSMSLNWRGQFEKIIAKDGFDALIAKIDKKVQKGEQ